LLGEEYPGYFPPLATGELAVLLTEAESNQDFRERLKAAVIRRQPLFSPESEKENWQDLLSELDSIK
jgi:hypothetical protein